MSLKETNKKIAEIISNPFAFNAGPETDAKDEAISEVKDQVSLLEKALAKLRSDH